MPFIGTNLPSDFSTLTWTSTTKTAERYDTVTGSVYSSHAGNLHVDQSGNGTNWDIVDTIAVSATTGTKIDVKLLLPFYRLRYVATTTQPTTFRVSTRLSAAGDS